MKKYHQGTVVPRKPGGFAKAGVCLYCPTHDVQKVVAAKNGQIEMACGCSRQLAIPQKREAA